MDFTEEDTQGLQLEISKNRRYQWLLLLASAAGIIGLSVFFITRSYNTSLESIEARELSRLSGIVNSVAAQIDGDQYERILNNYSRKNEISDNQQDADYKNVQQILSKVQKANNLQTDIYTLSLPQSEDGEDLFQFVVTSAEKPYFRHTYNDPSGMIRQHYTHGGMIPNYRSNTDTWVSAFASIHNNEGEVVGVVEADVKLTEILNQASSDFKTSVIGILAFTLFILIVVVTLTVFISRNILRAQHAIVDAFHRINTTFNLLSFFAAEIGKGNFENDLSEVEQQENNLSQSLLKMRENLLASKEDDEKRSWIIRGVAKFGEELRNQNNDLSQLSKSMVSGLVKYLEASQGAMYILNDEIPEQPFLDLRATYAYDRVKHLSGRIEKGDGLVGQCWQEGDKIFLTDVPSSYVNITSGLGGANPTCVIIVPLMVNEELFGVMELASFKVFENFEVEFIERVAESIASTISVVKVNERTTRLLEEAQMMTEEMQSKEEELRQNAEEMRATQEEMDRTIHALQEQLAEANAAAASS